MSDNIQNLLIKHCKEYMDLRQEFTNHIGYKIPDADNEQLNKIFHKIQDKFNTQIHPIITKLIHSGDNFDVIAYRKSLTILDSHFFFMTGLKKQIDKHNEK